MHLYENVKSIPITLIWCWHVHAWKISFTQNNPNSNHSIQYSIGQFSYYCITAITSSRVYISGNELDISLEKWKMMYTSQSFCDTRLLKPIQYCVFIPKRGPKNCVVIKIFGCGFGLVSNFVIRVIKAFKFQILIKVNSEIWVENFLA